jgi:hypothetical protein
LLPGCAHSALPLLAYPIENTVEWARHLHSTESASWFQGRKLRAATRPSHAVQIIGFLQCRCSSPLIGTRTQGLLPLRRASLILQGQ